MIAPRPASKLRGLRVSVVNIRGKGFRDGPLGVILNGTLAGV